MRPPVPPSVSRARRAERRAELVAAAVTAVRRHGAAVSVAEIATAAGITKPVIYRHFADRADLQRAVGELAAGTLVERIGAQMRGELGPAERIQRMIGTFLECIDDDPELWRFVVHHPAGHTAGGAPGTEVVDDTRERIVGMLVDLLGDHLGHDHGGLAVWAHGLVGMVQSTADWWLERRTMSREALADHLTALAWGGLAGTVASTEPGTTIPDRPTRGTP